MLEVRKKGVVLTIVLNEKQIQQVYKTVGCSRFVFNYFLDMRNTYYKYTSFGMTYNQTSEDLTILKQEKLFLKEVDKFALQNSLRDLDKAFTNFFEKRAKYPKFKSKRNSKKSYRTNFTKNNIEIDVTNKKIKLPKLGWVPFLNDLDSWNYKILSATVTIQPKGTFTVSLNFEETIENPIEIKEKYTTEELKKLLLENQVIAGDLGIRTYLTCSNGVNVENPKTLDRKLKQLGKWQRQLSRKEKGSQNYIKLQKKITKLHAHIANARKDFLHKLSHALTDNYQIIVLEDLHVKGLIKNRKLSRRVQDASWGMFKTFVEYKANWKGKNVVFISQWFPSSKLCSNCQVKNPMLTLSDEIWTCPNCGSEHLRDTNASYNILVEGLRQLIN